MQADIGSIKVFSPNALIFFQFYRSLIQEMGDLAMIFLSCEKHQLHFG